MRAYYDLHVHSCLSPCADDDMTPNNVANMACVCGLDIIALTDHNSFKNCPAFFSACQKAGVLPVAGTELCTREEVHVICLFPSLEAGMCFGAFVAKKMPGFINNPKIFGRQPILDSEDRFVAEEPILLVSACDIGIGELPGLMRAYGGAAVPAHIDRPVNGLIANLGFIPPEYAFTCYELKDGANLPRLMKTEPALNGALVIYDSDAHSLTAIHERANSLDLPEKSAEALIRRLSEA